MRAMPSIEPAHGVQLFNLSDSFESDFDEWLSRMRGLGFERHNEAVEVEIVAEEPVIRKGDTVGLLVFWRFADPL